MHNDTWGLSGGVGALSCWEGLSGWVEDTCYSKVLRLKPELFGSSIFMSVSDFKKPTESIGIEPITFKLQRSCLTQGASQLDGVEEFSLELLNLQKCD